MTSAPTEAAPFDGAAVARDADRRAHVLRERIYATFTGISILIALLFEADHVTALDALIALPVGIGGICIAGLVADVVGHQVTHGRTPSRHDLGTMVRSALNGFASAIVPVVALAGALISAVSIEMALQIGIGMYFLTLIAISLLAVLRSRLDARQVAVALVLLPAAGAVVVAALVLAHAI